MTSSSKRQPVLVLGPHRSGTSLTARVLAALGVHLGARVDQNAESTFMQRLNRRLVDEIGAHWSTPCVATKLLRAIDAEQLIRMSEQVAQFMQGPLFHAEYWGLRRSAPVWGWKDPRNVLLLPIYDRIFPDAKLVILRRHPLESAASLNIREDRREDGFARSGDAHRLYRLDSMRRLMTARPLVRPAWRASSRRGSFEICLEYAELHAKLTNVRDAVVIDYDDLLARPTHVVDELTDSLAIPAGVPQRAMASEIPQPNPKQEVWTDPGWTDLLTDYGDRLSVIGFG